MKDGKIKTFTDGKSRNDHCKYNKNGDCVAYTSTKHNGKDWYLYIAPTTSSLDNAVISGLVSLVHVRFICGGLTKATNAYLHLICYSVSGFYLVRTNIGVTLQHTPILTRGGASIIIIYCVNSY
jgi:hypothetical protein